MAALALAGHGRGQVSQDQAAWAAARAQVDPAARLAALQTFVSAYPDSGYRDVAGQALLQLRLDSNPTGPTQTAAIHRTATDLLAHTEPGLERWTEESRLGNQLADAGDHGADLDDAAHWAADAVHSLTEPAYLQQVQRTRVRYHLPALTARQLHAAFRRDRAAALTALANVRLQQGQQVAAAPLITEALHLTPGSSQALRLRAELALAQGRDADALTDLIQADALFPLPPQWRAREAALFHNSTGGDVAELDRREDEAYKAAYAPLFQLPARTLPAGGHPALLQLFTGSDCLPCAGPDLAVDSLLATYPRQDLIVLELDVHIPHPDPLATPATLEQANSYGVERTPTAFLDGQPLDIPGSTRDDVENLVIAFADQIESAAQTPSLLALDLAVRWTSPDTLDVQPYITLGPVPAQADQPHAPDVAQLPQGAILHMALVQDHLRYAGKNGVRTHRMVVRALLQAPVSSFGQPSVKNAFWRFDLQALQARQDAYLTSFETQNDRFGAIHFRQKAFPMSPADLAVVAWVQDPLSRRVLQSTSVAAPPR